MGAPSDMAPPAPLNTTRVADSSSVRDAAPAKVGKTRHGRTHHRSSAHKTDAEAPSSESGLARG
jgi:hypothetical protein